jgi:hypothetical protein
MLDHREHVHPRARHGDRLEEITRQQRIGLPAQERSPRGGAAGGRRVDPGVLQDLPDGGGRDLHPEHQQFPVQSTISPGRVPAGQAHDEQTDRAHGARAARPPGARTSRVPTRDQLAVPLEHGVRPDQQMQLRQHSFGYPVQQRRQYDAIARGEPHPCRTELPLQHGQLMAKRQDLRVLVPKWATAAASRMCSSCRDRPVAAARPITMPRR